jgi:hypothetical protein
VTSWLVTPEPLFKHNMLAAYRAAVADVPARVLLNQEHQVLHEQIQNWQGLYAGVPMGRGPRRFATWA